MKKLNVSFISCWYPNIGVSDYTCELMSALQELKEIEKIKIVSGSCWCEARVNKASKQGCNSWYPSAWEKIFKFFFRKYYNLPNSILRAIWTNFKTLNSDIVHYQLCAGSFGFISLLSFLLLPKKAKKVVTLHEIVFSNRFSKILKPIIEKIDAVIVHTDFSKKKLIQIFPYLESKIRIIYHGVKIPELKHYLRDKITFFGPPVESRGIYILLNAMTILNEKNTPITLHIYGPVLNFERKEIMNYAEKNKITENIVFGGELSENIFFQKLQKSKILIVPRLEAHASSTIIKAMACETPIIATNIGGIPEYLGNAGILIPPNNAEVLADTIQKLNADEKTRKKIGISGRKRAKRIFQWSKIAEKTLKLYRCLML
ncbi:glycosyltransferase family 4 protein [Candidatus Borrarchaeum sp.]|uniref:glycosyltransferase family 4 protein n=1 Tax=Candidatus Borrarchaeum sp. TaxID=2846742 RepID=UPI00257CE63D|nr:glycosyltransferase family 4 protein [Candidatus Borrarchaeum sp.]